MLLRIGLISMTQGTRKRNFGKAGEYTPVTAGWHGRRTPAPARKQPPGQSQQCLRANTERRMADKYHDQFSTLTRCRR